MAIIKIRNAAIDLDAAEIPNLPATKITSGTFDNARISLDAAEIPNLDTAKITTGTLADARVPNLNASKITAGTIATARLGSGTANATTFLRGDNTFAEAGGGKILQVISATDSTTRTTTSTSYVTSSNTMSVTITPSATSSKIFIVASFGAVKNSGVTAFTVFRGGSAITGADTLALLKMVNDMPQNGGFNFLDSPSSTSSLVYQLYFRSVEGSNESKLNPSNATQGTGVITCFEIGA